jgi:hypothetical protein
MFLDQRNEVFEKMNGNSMSPENKMRGNNVPLWSKRGRTASSTD